MEFVKKEFKQLLILLILFLINILLFKYKMVDLYIDFGKEMYIPKAIARGGVLYKDVLALFGPFAYLFNAAIVKLFGASIKVFTATGAVNAYLLLCGLYALCREFLQKLPAVAITCFVLYFCCFNPDVMNFVTPYSYGMVYGLCAIIFAAVFFVKYLKSDKNIFLYLSSFLCGLAASNKYEFVLPFFVVFVFLIIKRTNFLKVLKSAACFMVMPILCISVLLLQGLSFSELIGYLDIWFKFANSADMKAYYNGTFYFSFDYFLIALKSFAFSFVLLSLLYWLNKGIETVCKNNKNKTAALYAVLLIACFVVGILYSQVLINFVFYSVAMVLFVLTALKIKELCKNLPVFFLCLFSLAVGIKSFFFVQINQYGRYFLPLLLLALILVLNEVYFQKAKETFVKTVVFFLVLMSSVAFVSNIRILTYLNTKISTPYGTVYKDEISAKVFNTMLETVDKMTEPQDTVVVLQEGLLLNFLSGRKADKYNYLIPSLLNLYGEDNVVGHFEKVKPEMFVILTSPNDKAFICNGWGYKICGFVSKNYKLVQTIKADNLILIFKKI